MGPQAGSSRLRRWGAVIAVPLVAGWAVACGDSPTAPTPPPPAPGPSLTCPASIATQSPDGQAVEVTYMPPVAQDGAAPVAVTCAPSGAFPVGATTVTCTAVDALSRSASCSFTVTVQPPPRLAYTRFLAFGDSLTAGVVSPAPMLLVIALPDSYPSKLLPKLQSRYGGQTIVVDNVGNPGEYATQGAVRLPIELASHQPEVVLIMEGTNDLVNSDPRQIVPVLEGMILDARAHGVLPMIATIPPQRPGGPRDRVAKIIPSFNDLIRLSPVVRQSALLVDVFAVMSQDLSLIGQDDLHPTVQGYEVMSQVFYDAIVRNLEMAPSTRAR